MPGETEFPSQALPAMSVYITLLDDAPLRVVIYGFSMTSG
jgi:hypothetical protein